MIGSELERFLSSDLRVNQIYRVTRLFKYSLSLSQSIETDNYTVVNPVAPWRRFLATAQPVNGRFEMREEKL
jgi:hypothetical protein